jgi:hypothetical protein
VQCRARVLVPLALCGEVGFDLVVAFEINRDVPRFSKKLALNAGVVNDYVQLWKTIR